MFEGAAGPGVAQWWLTGASQPREGLPHSPGEMSLLYQGPYYWRASRTGKGWLKSVRYQSWNTAGISGQSYGISFIALSSCPGTAPGILLVDGYCLLFQSLRISFSSDHNSRQYSVIFSTFVFCPLHQIALPWLELNFQQSFTSMGPTVR